MLYSMAPRPYQITKIQQIIDHYQGKLMNDKVVSLEDYKIKMSLEV